MCSCSCGILCSYLAYLSLLGWLVLLSFTFQRHISYLLCCSRYIRIPSPPHNPYPKALYNTAQPSAIQHGAILYQPLSQQTYPELNSTNTTPDSIKLLPNNDLKLDSQTNKPEQKYTSNNTSGNYYSPHTQKTKEVKFKQLGHLSYDIF